MKKTKTRVAVIQAASIAFDTEKTLEKVDQYTRDAASQGAELVLFPEAFIGSYPRGASFGVTVGNRTVKGREQFLKYWNASIEVSSEETRRLAEVARQNNVYLTIGVIEREGGTLYCTVLFFSNRGAYMGKHRKLMPTGSERLVWGQGDGSTMPVFDTQVGKIGAVICWENYMPLMRTAYYAKGIELYLAPTADGKATWLPTMIHIAMEGRCFVLSANQYSTRADFPVGFDTIFGDDPDSILAVGGSCIISPMGEVLAGPAFDGECVLVADLDMDDIGRAKFDFDVVGHYARPDIFHLSVNESPSVSVTFEGSAAEGITESFSESDVDLE